MLNAVRNSALVACLAFLLSNAAFAAIDVSEAVTEIEGGAAPVAALGIAVLVILAGVKIFKLVRRAM